MNIRLSTTLAICLVASVITAVALFRPAGTPTATGAAAAAPAAAVATTAPGWTGDAPAQAGAEPAAAAAPVVAPASVTIADFSFGGDLVAQPGQSITVTNADGAPHTMTANDGSFDTGLLDPGAAGAVTAPAAPGTYPFFCALHPSMTANLTVAGG